MRRLHLFGAASGTPSVSLVLSGRAAAVGSAAPHAAAALAARTMATSAAREQGAFASILSSRGSGFSWIRPKTAGDTALLSRLSAVGRLIGPLATGTVQSLSVVFRGGSRAGFSSSPVAHLKQRTDLRASGRVGLSGGAAFSARISFTGAGRGEFSFGVVALTLRGVGIAAKRALAAFSIPLALRSSARSRLQSEVGGSASLSSRQTMVLTLTPATTGKTILSSRIGTAGKARPGIQAFVPLALSAVGTAVSALRGVFGLQPGYIGAQMINIQMF